MDWQLERFGTAMLAALLAFCLTGGSGWAQSRQIVRLNGTVGGMQVKMNLIVPDDGGTVKGVCHYRQPDHHVLVSGTIDGEGQLQMVEVDDKGCRIGRFAGRLSADGNLFAGEWQADGAQSTHPVRLCGNDATSGSESKSADARFVSVSRPAARVMPTLPTALPGPSVLDQADALIHEGQLVEARTLLNKALTGNIYSPDAPAIRKLISRLNQTLVFSGQLFAGDPLVDSYTVAPGDLLIRIAERYQVPWQLLRQVNGDLDPRSLKVGQKIKVVKGPLHLLVRKRDYACDLFGGSPEQPVYLCSFPVGLGRADGTPTGLYLVSSKVENPGYDNPQTGHFYKPEDPANPVGEHWIALSPLAGAGPGRSGLGVHGTIDPSSIGRSRSGGCVRLKPEDIVKVYHMLTPGRSTVKIAD